MCFRFACLRSTDARVSPLLCSASTYSIHFHPLGLAWFGDEKIATVGLYGAKKVVAFAKAVLKGRKEARKDVAVTGESAAVEATNEDDEDQGGDEDAAKVFMYECAFPFCLSHEGCT